MLLIDEAADGRWGSADKVLTLEKTATRKARSPPPYRPRARRVGAEKFAGLSAIQSKNRRMSSRSRNRSTSAKLVASSAFDTCA